MSSGERETFAQKWNELCPDWTPHIPSDAELYGDTVLAWKATAQHHTELYEWAQLGKIDAIDSSRKRCQQQQVDLLIHSDGALEFLVSIGMCGALDLANSEVQGTMSGMQMVVPDLPILAIYQIASNCGSSPCHCQSGVHERAFGIAEH